MKSVKFQGFVDFSSNQVPIQVDFTQFFFEYFHLIQDSLSVSFLFNSNSNSAHIKLELRPESVLKHFIP